ncbi:MAG: chemotaxis protein CheR [Candidimonas sp.]|nr:MAG: chemotaxis protein CheR [Candidimonas sp.]
MFDVAANAYERADISEDDIARAKALLKAHAGIVLPDHRRDAVVRVITQRARATARGDTGSYLSALATQTQSPEWDEFTAAFTINHTAFFREAHHFRKLEAFLRGRRSPISIWCCAASTGEEPYSIAMTLRETVPAAAVPGVILATDVDSRAIDAARAGVYTLARVEPVGDARLKKYFHRGRGAQAGRVRVKPELASLVEFGAANLCADPAGWPLAAREFDAIFCRNVLIYFDHATQRRVLQALFARLKPQGLIFVGHSENFSQIVPGLKLLGQTVYVRDG